EAHRKSDVLASRALCGSSVCTLRVFTFLACTAEPTENSAEHPERGGRQWALLRPDHRSFSVAPCIRGRFCSGIFGGILGLHPVSWCSRDRHRFEAPHHHLLRWR